MSNIFRPDSKFTHYANKFSDLITLNLWFVITSIPLITIGASATAMHYVLLKIYRDDLDNSVTRNFFSSFRKNWSQATLIWIIYLLFFAILIADFFLMQLNILENSLFIKILLSVVSLLLLLSLNWVFVLQSRYSNPFYATIRNAIAFSILYFLNTLLMSALFLVPIMLLLCKPSTIPIILICGFSLSGMIRTTFYNRIFVENKSSEDSIISDQ